MTNRGSLHRVFPSVALCALFLASCEGPEGPTGPAGPAGNTGPQGPATAAQCPTADTLGLHAEVTVSKPAAGGFFSAGEAPEVTVRFLDRCERLVALKDLGTANLYLNGPRAALKNVTAVKLLNCVVDRAAPDRQHHFINLIAPKYADPAKPGLTVDADGTVHYRLSPITSEAAGTYTVGVWAKTKDEKEQLFPLTDFQIGTATAETYASGTATDSTCVDCHRGPATGKLYMTHITPGFSPLGNYALDMYPIGTCRSCHNQDGYSRNTSLRKIHAAHRGEHQQTPGVAHPEYGQLEDTTLKEFLNVGFPAMPDAEKDCAKCHKDDRWRTAPSQQGCGTCHETLFFNTGTLTPPRRFAQACTGDTDCTSIGQLATCDIVAKSCVIASHPKQMDDSQCATCHSADNAGIVPIQRSHEQLTKTRVRNIKLSDVTLSGGSGMDNTVMVGDTLTVKFKLADGTGAAVADLKTATTLSGTLLVGGPTTDRQLVYPNLAIKTTGTLTYDAGTYTYVLPSPFPARSQAPLNNPGTTQLNVPGTYSAYLYVVETLTVNGAQVRDVAQTLVNFRFADAQLPLRPRQVITAAACNSCHTLTQAHGGTRRDAEACSICHAAGAVDRTVGAIGGACTSDANCRAWEACRDTNNDMKIDSCVITQDPTPDRTIQFSAMIHSTHYARRLDGYGERADLLTPGQLSYIGNRNSVNNFSEILFPLDVRNCGKCHGDSGATCSATAPCGVGQACVGGKCVNNSTQNASSGACLSCHDSAAAYGHAALNTWRDKDGVAVETCAVCHSANAEFAVSKAHNISAPFVPPYPREKE